jgi:AcrR family transcriptional regulator
MPAGSIDKAFTPKRGRPNAEQVAAIERAILATASRMFLEAGYDAVAMEAIATVTGVSKGTLYARYSSKEALFTAVIRQRVQEWSLAAGQEDHLLTSDIGERLRHHALTIARSLLLPEVSAFQRLTVATRERFPELARAMYEVGYLFIVRLLTRDIMEAAIRDGIPARDPEGTARLLVSALAGWELQESSNGPINEADIVRAANQTVDLLMAARENW